MSIPLLLLVLAATMISCEIALRCPWKLELEAFRSNTGKSIKVLRSSHISDHFKERVLPVYSLRNLRACGQILFFLVLVMLPFSGPALFDYQAGGTEILSAKAALTILAASVVYTGARLYFGK
jgi:hypothetical protein